jgi:hypothetical protein
MRLILNEKFKMMYTYLTWRILFIAFALINVLFVVTKKFIISSIHLLL